MSEIEFIIKIGGSLLNYPSNLIELCKHLSNLSKKHLFLIVPGGGPFADLVREMQAKLSFSNGTAHFAAIYAMNQVGLIISELIPNSLIVECLTEVRENARYGKAIIFLPFKMMLKSKLPKSWEVTSDSIAAYIAGEIGVQLLFKLTDVDGVFNDNPENNPSAKLIHNVKASELKNLSTTCVDKFLPNLLLEYKVKCVVINGLIPSRIDDFLLNRQVNCTIIEPA